MLEEEIWLFRYKCTEHPNIWSLTSENFKCKCEFGFRYKYAAYYRAVTDFQLQKPVQTKSTKWNSFNGYTSHCRTQSCFELRLLGTLVSRCSVCVVHVLGTVSELVPNASIIKRAGFKCHSSSSKLHKPAQGIVRYPDLTSKSKKVGEPDNSKNCLLKQ